MKHVGYMAIDQYGQTYHLSDCKSPRQALLSRFGAKSASKMYVDLKSGGVRHTGYIIKGLWLSIYSVSIWKDGVK
jgi:hypothetical protein